MRSRELSLLFVGAFSCRHASDPDPPDDPAGHLGFGWAGTAAAPLTGEVAFDSPGAKQRDTRIRQEHSRSPVRVSAVRSGRRELARSTYLGAEVSLVRRGGAPPTQFFIWNNVLGNRLHRQLVVGPLDLKISSGSYQLLCMDVGFPSKLATVDLAKDSRPPVESRFPMSMRMLSNAELVLRGLPTPERWLKQRLARLSVAEEVACTPEERFAIQRRRTWIELFAVRSPMWGAGIGMAHRFRMLVEWVLAVEVRASQDGAVSTHPGRLHLEMFGWDDDLMRGRVSGTLKLDGNTTPDGRRRD